MLLELESTRGRNRSKKDQRGTLKSRGSGVIFRKVNLVSQDVNVLALVKGEERFIFLYNESSKSETLRTLGRFASDPELNFSWYDAAVLSQKLRGADSESKSRLDQTVQDSGSSWDE